MTVVMIAACVAVVAVVLTAVAYAAIDLVRIGARALDRLRVRRVARRGWDWAAFERDLAGYERGRRLQRGR